MQLKHTAFIELNQKAVVEVMYGDEDYQTYKGMRVLGIDGSKIMLPFTPNVIEEFGEISHSNAGGKTCLRNGECYVRRTQSDSSR